MRKSTKIYVPTMLIAKVKGHSSNKILFVEDFYDLTDIPVYKKNDFELLEVPRMPTLYKNNQYSTLLDGCNFHINSDEVKILDNSIFMGTFPNMTLCHNDNSGSSEIINYNGKYCVYPGRKKDKYFSGYYTYNQLFVTEKISEILFDEKKDIEKKLNIIKKDLFYVEDEFGNFQLYINIPVLERVQKPEDMMTVAPENIRSIFNYCTHLNKNTYIPEYAIDEIIKKCILNFIRDTLEYKNDDFENIKENTKLKKDQSKILDIIDKYYGDDFYCVLSSSKIENVLYAKRFLNKNFMEDIINFKPESETSNKYKNANLIDFLIEKNKNIQSCTL